MFDNIRTQNSKSTLTRWYCIIDGDIVYHGAFMPEMIRAPVYTSNALSAEENAAMKTWRAK